MELLEEDKGSYIRSPVILWIRLLTIYRFCVSGFTSLEILTTKKPLGIGSYIINIIVLENSIESLF